MNTDNPWPNAAYMNAYIAFNALATFAVQWVAMVSKRKIGTSAWTRLLDYRIQISENLFNCQVIWWVGGWVVSTGGNPLEDIYRGGRPLNPKNGRLY